MKTYLREATARLAVTAVGIPYVWGGAIPAHGLDCSGFIVWLLHVAGALTQPDLSAQGLFNETRPLAGMILLDPSRGNLAFYGHDTKQVSHVMLTLGEGQVIGACGGDRTCLDEFRARALGAQVRIKQIHYRGDLLAIHPVHYPDE